VMRTTLFWMLDIEISCLMDEALFGQAPA